MKLQTKPGRQRGGIISGLASLTCCLSSLSLFAASNGLLPTASALSQKEALYHLHAGLNGDIWDRQWDTDSDDICNTSQSDPAAYPGVTCNSNGKVTSIDLSDNNMAGRVSPHIYTLPLLKSLNLSKNRITDAGWDRLDVVLTGDNLLANLEVMDLTNNLINTVQGIGRFSDTLRELHMTYNNLKGTIPQKLFEMKELEILAISENELTGEIPTELGELTNLMEFYCYGNKMTGEIPSEIGKLTKMKIITFAENKLSGPLPEEIKNMGNLRTFSVHNNDPDTGSHSGLLPHFDTHPFLHEIYLDGNAFSGPIPRNFLGALNGTTGEVVTMGLSNNKLTDHVPREFLKFDSLVLNIIGNEISGFDVGICDSNDIGDWMNGMVELYGCDAILCTRGTYLATGRQEEEEAPCQICSGGTGGKPGATTCASVDEGPVDELQILAEFYLALGGKQWDETDGWNAFENLENFLDLTLPTYQEKDIDPCLFKGVQCSGGPGGQIFEISLPNNGLEGLIPSRLWNLPSLTEIDLSGNEVHLDRDYGFGDMGNAKSLRKVDLSSNDIQSFKGIARATALEELYCDDAYFFSGLEADGTGLLQLEQLKILHMQFSGLKGSIPKELSDLKSLRALNLYGNDLTGKIPTEIGLMNNLWHIDFSENDLTGHLPTVALKNLVNLQKFHVHQSGRGGQGIIGQLPAFAEQTKLHMLDLNSNTMTGSIPNNFLSGIDDPTQMMEIDISYNKFDGTVPATLQRFTNMRFEAIKNQITGINLQLCQSNNVNGWFGGSVGTLVTDVGTDACDAIMCPKGTYNDYGRAKGANQLCNDCPNGLYAGSTTCDINGDGTPDAGVADDDTVDIDMDGDGVADNLEKKILDKLYYATGGANWTESSDSWTQGDVCQYEGITCDAGSVTEIDLAGYGLIADIPTQIYQLPSLKKLDVSNNIVDLSFDGIGAAVELEEILMDDADLSNVKGIENAPSLKKLHIPRNSFPEGSIPSELYEVSTLESLAFSYNGFTGSILPDVVNLVNLKEFWGGSNDITGSFPEDFSSLQNLVSVVLSSNRMSGEIPNEIEDITTLRQLHLNGQRDFGGFTGPLPSFQNSEHLHDLDFSGNSLTGSIPDTFLETVRTSPKHSDYAYDKIDLSSNQITGAIPADWDDFVGLYINLANNRITDVPNVLCDDDDEFMNGMVGNLTTNKCDAILCPPGTFTAVGFQMTPGEPCKQCSSNKAEREEAAPFYGSLKCNPVSHERTILKEIHGLIFTGASTDTYWKSIQPICSWYGVQCDDPAGDQGVKGIELESNSLATDDPSTVSELLFSLPDLEKLNIRGNEGLSLTFEFVDRPERLKMLQVSATGLTSIEGIGKAKKLEELHFTENEISGPFPSEIFDLTSMEKLYISFNKISGPLPTRIGELTNLKEFYAYTNAMTGELPSELGLLTKMENLVLGQNGFEGTLPNELNNLANLKEFSLYYGGDLTGPILDFAKVTSIEKFDLEGNQFTGQIPSTFLTGLNSDYIADSGNEIILHLADNALTGTLPESLSEIENLYLDIVGNQFKELPTSYCGQSFWMNGRVGEVSNSCQAIACPVNTFSVSGRMPKDGQDKCNPCGEMEAAPFIGSYSCAHVQLEMTALKALYQATSGGQWTKNENWLDYDKPICSWYGVECAGDKSENSTITEINLPDNSLDGTMPPVIFQLPALKTLNLKENNIFMNFGNIHRANKLEMFYISDIDLGSINGIGKAPALKELHLTANELTGEIPKDFFELSDTLERLYIAYNSFSGTLSTEFGKMKNLMDFYAYDNEFTGSIPKEFASLPNLQNLVLAENKLSGIIAEEFSYMPQLTLFSAYRRLKPGPKLSGPLPSFSNVPKLEGLYLDYNHLAGMIPSDFLKSSLNTNLITISHNLLAGPVPIELAKFGNLNIEMEGNKITEVDNRFCDKTTWMNGLMTKYGCDAFMCPPKHYSIYGRQNSTESGCEKCEDNTDPTPYWGSISCDSVVDEKEILKLLYSRCGGKDWHNNDNWLSADDICTWYGIECRDGQSVQSIRLGANNLIGTPPEELFRLHQLHTLWLHSNPIEFKFRGIGKAKNLVDLRLDSTGLSDVFGIGEGTSLIKLDLKYNQISGGFPMELLKLDKLESLSLTDNSLGGQLPRFGDLSQLIQLRLGSNVFSGQLSANMFGELKHLIHLDLSDNDFVGTIPKNFLNAISAHKPIEVDLSSNSLSGAVPSDLDRLDQLVIYLRGNKFTQLDPSLCDADNRGWNLREVEMYGCAAVMCPPGTANYHGRQSGENNPCMTCESNTDFYGQTTCDGLPIAFSSSTKLAQSIVATFISSLLLGALLVLV